MKDDIQMDFRYDMLSNQGDATTTAALRRNQEVNEHN